MNLINMDLLLRSVLFSCAFYIISHNKTFKYVSSLMGKKTDYDHVLLVLMAIYVFTYYIVSLLIDN